tara:strand:+ start:173 stop:721 length:549 start_codon:yes stop_codon:yes gene_type:complete
MKILLFIFLILIPADLFANDKAWDLLKEGNKIVFIRHSLAPGGGDPSNFNLTKCSTQRNLNQAGINQSKKIGELFKKNKVPVDKVLTSQWCRCKDTAFHAFGKYEEFFALNSTFQAKFSGNGSKQRKALKKYIKNWNGNGKNLILVTHYVITIEHTDYAPSSGEVVVVNKSYKVLASIPTLD